MVVMELAEVVVLLAIMVLHLVLVGMVVVV
jgi:hypothetical protein